MNHLAIISQLFLQTNQKMDSQDHISTGSLYMISIKETSAQRVLNKIIVHYIVIIQ